MLHYFYIKLYIFLFLCLYERLYLRIYKSYGYRIRWKHVLLFLENKNFFRIQLRPLLSVLIEQTLLKLFPQSIFEQPSCSEGDRERKKLKDEYINEKTINRLSKIRKCLYKRLYLRLYKSYGYQSCWQFVLLFSANKVHFRIWLWPL